MSTPKDFNPVLAKIASTNDLGRSEYWEVVYYDGDKGLWCSYTGSDTFEDGEVVLGWQYCNEISLKECKDV